MSSAFLKGLKTITTAVDGVSEMLDATWQEDETTTSKTVSKNKGKDDEKEKDKKTTTATEETTTTTTEASKSDGDKIRYHNEEVTVTSTSSKPLPTPLTNIPRLVERITKSSNDHLLKREDFVKNMLGNLGSVVNPSPFYVLIISTDFLADCYYKFEGVVFDDRVTWKVGSWKRQYYRVIVFSHGNIKLASVDDGFKSFGFTNGIRSGLNLSYVKWIEKSIRESDTYGTGNQGWLRSTGRLDKQMARLDIFYSTYIHGLKMIFADGTIELLGIEVGNYYSFGFTFGEFIMGTTLTATNKLNNIEFRTNYGRVTDKLGYNWQGDQFDVSFNGPLNQMTAVVNQGIENIKFHWL